MNKEKCPICREEAEYIEFECTEAFTSPFELRFKALYVWGAYSAPKAVICRNSEYVHFVFTGNGKTRLVKMLGFDREKFTENSENLRNTKKPCEHTDNQGKNICSAQGNAIFTLFEPGEPVGYYCDDHCFENGACRGCYTFLAGLELFDFSVSGYCDECEQQIKSEFSDDENDEYNFGDEDDNFPSALIYPPSGY